MTSTVRPGDVIKYKRDGRFTVVTHVDGGRWQITTGSGKFAGKTRTVTLDADTVIVERAPIDPPAADDVPTVDINADLAGTTTETGYAADEIAATDAGLDADPATERPAGRKYDKYARRATAKKPQAAAAKPRRADLVPDGHVTPGQLAKVINERGLYTGSLPELPGRFVHSAALRSSRKHPSPFRRDRRDNGSWGPMHAPLEEALTWWTAKNGRRTKTA